MFCFHLRSLRHFDETKTLTYSQHQSCAISPDGEHGLIKFIKDIEPLDFDSALAAEYLTCFQSDENKLSVMDELEHLYEGLDNVKERLERLSVIGDSNIFFWDDDEDVDYNELFETDKDI